MGEISNNSNISTTQAKVVFNPVKGRWLHVSDTKPFIFKGETVSDYDDPTYLTFKIEFGDWGASILDRQLLQQGVTVFNATHSDFDALPIGLLNCPAPGTDDANSTYWQDGAGSDGNVFNNAPVYSAFQWLRSRNEDVRAEYLYAFVNGLMEIQRETPYLFSKISGLSALEQHDPKVGWRVKQGTNITVECAAEGLALKIRTLMELYRKAAWDDVYQRWILPENMREFKMIIYIFERGIFHKVSTKSAGGNTLDIFQNDDDLNAAVPMKVYECSPCEFIIGDTGWKGDYTTESWDQSETSKLIINVKNVKTYFKNGLLTSGNVGPYSQLDKLLIYDLMDTVERIHAGHVSEEQSGIIASGSVSVNQARSLFMNKNLLLEREDLSPETYMYIHGLPTAGVFQKDADIAGMANMAVNDFKGITSLVQEVSRHRSLQHAGLQVTRESMQQIYEQYRDLFQAVTLHSLNGGDFTLSKATSSILSMYQVKIEGERQLTDSINTPGMDPARIWDAKYLEHDLSGRTYIPEIKHVDINARQIDEQIKYSDFKERGDISIGEYPKMKERQTPDMVEQDPFNDRSLIDMLDNDIEGPRDIADITAVPVDKERDIILSPDKPDYSEREKADLTDSPLEDEREKPSMPPYPEIIPRTLNMTMDEFIFYMRTPEKMSDLKFDDARTMNQVMDKLVMTARKLTDMQTITIDDIRQLSDTQIEQLFDNIRQVTPEYIADSAKMMDAVRNVMVTPDKQASALEEKLRVQEKDMIAMLKDNTALESVNKDDSLKLSNMLSFAKTLSENSDAVREDYLQMIKLQLTKLKEVTFEMVERFPKIINNEIQDNNKEGSMVTVSIDDMRQLTENIQYIGFQDEHINNLSMPSLMAFQSILDEHIHNTENKIGLSQELQDIQRQQQPITAPKMETEKKKRKLGIDYHMEEARTVNKEFLPF